MLSPRSLIVRAIARLLFQAISECVVQVLFMLILQPHGFLFEAVPHDKNIIYPIRYFITSRLKKSFGGHSGKETPVPIPNTEDKLASVLYGTKVCEPLGNIDRCRKILFIFLIW